MTGSTVTSICIKFGTFPSGRVSGKGIFKISKQKFLFLGLLTRLRENKTLKMRAEEVTAVHRF